MSQPMNAGGYIPSWDESKPVGYYPGEDDTDNARCECGRFIPCRHCPTPIDPADIRPGDVVERALIDRITVTEHDGWAIRGRRDNGSRAGLGILGPENITVTWNLVHRPDPDAEAVEALARFLHDESGCLDPFGTCISTSENYRSQARRIVEFQRRNGQEHA